MGAILSNGAMKLSIINCRYIFNVVGKIIPNNETYHRHDSVESGKVEWGFPLVFLWCLPRNILRQGVTDGSNRALIADSKKWLCCGLVAWNDSFRWLKMLISDILKPCFCR